MSSGESSYGQQLAQSFDLTRSTYTNLVVDSATSRGLLYKLSDPSTIASISSVDTIVLSIGGNYEENQMFYN